MRRISVILFACMAWPALSLAQDQTVIDLPTQQVLPDVAAAGENQKRCIRQMADFPTDNPTVRYQFFKLVDDVAYGATDEARGLFDYYGQPVVAEGTAVLSAIEVIANPVLRQAAPESVVASMNYLVDFAVTCDVYITGQIDSLLAFDGSLRNPELNEAITEDALFLRQILSESLSRLGADTDTVWMTAAQNYTQSLVTQRNEVEFETFQTDIAELETLFMNDLDGRLARSNDVINSEIDTEIMGDAIQLSETMNEDAKEKAKQDRLYRLMRLFVGGR